MSATDRKLESISRSLKAGFSFGPRVHCACCHARNGDPDSISRGLCERCWAMIERLNDE